MFRHGWIWSVRQTKKFLNNMSEAQQLVQWESTLGSTRSFIIVEDNSEIGDFKIELCERNSENEKWETIEVLDYVEEFLSFGIPESFID